MSLLFDEMLVVDLECACWRGAPPPGMTNEIIEIGIAAVSLTELRITRSESLVIKPKKAEISKFCTKLTGITPEEAANGIKFGRACEILREEYLSRRRTWASWGTFDRDKMGEETARRRIEPAPFGENHWNLKNLVTVLFGWEQEPGLLRALEQLNLPHDGRAHRGVDDAIAAAQVLIEILKLRPCPTPVTAA